MGNFKIYVETDDAFSVCVSEHSDFQSAKQQYQKLIGNLLGNQKLCSKGVWDEFTEEFPDVIKRILHSYESEGCVDKQEDVEGDTDNYHYSISGICFEIIDREGAEYAPDYLLQTNTLGMDGSEDLYEFRIWAGMGRFDQALWICMMRSA